jgi:hypothetical protein
MSSESDAKTIVMVERDVLIRRGGGRIRSARSRRWYTAWIYLVAAGVSGWGCAVAGSEPLTREKLVGSWYLVRIEYSGPRGARVDPFYQAGSTGLLIYDPSGWMSVQIAGPHRHSFEVPAARLAPDPDPERSSSKAAAFDSFYAYDGTWEFNSSTSELIHHVVASLLPAESGMTYTQRVTLEGGRLVFSNRAGKAGEETVRRKIWARAEPQVAFAN